VAARRKSQSGTHWCSEPVCVAAKQRFYRRHRSTAEQEKLQNRQNKADRLDLVVYALRGKPRHACEGCGREDGIPGFVHPTPDWSAPCDRLGLRGNLAGIEWVAAVWPKDS
jgi:hypothetical protein